MKLSELSHVLKLFWRRQQHVVAGKRNNNKRYVVKKEEIKKFWKISLKIFSI